MQILLLSLLILLILIGQIYKIINDKKKISREAFDMVNKKKHQEEYWENSIRYYNSLGDKGLQDTIEQIEKNEYSDNFVALDSNNVLVETFHGKSSRRSIENAIETCRSLTKCEQLDEFPKCGYCGSSNSGKGKFDYDGGTGIAPDVCLPSKEIAAYSDGYSGLTASSHSPDAPRGNQWAKTKYDCLKVQRQNKCDKVETCTQMTEGCGWCPSDSRAKVKTSGKKALLLYDGASDKEANSKIKSDKCPDLGLPYPGDPENLPLFSELTQTGSCSVCDAPGPDGQAKGATGLHSKQCLQSLWAAPYIDPSGIYNVTCDTEYDDSDTANEGHYGNGNSNTGNKPYYVIAAEMKNKLKRPIAKFMKEHDELNQGIGGGDGQQHWKLKGGKYRRDYDIDNTKNGEIHVDEMWKKCFGENSKGNVKDNFGKNE